MLPRIAHELAHALAHASRDPQPLSPFQICVADNPSSYMRSSERVSSSSCIGAHRLLGKAAHARDQVIARVADVL